MKNTIKTNIYDYKNYKSFVNFTIKEMPNHGRGQFRRISEHLKVSSVLISQIFKGDRDLTLEQGFLLCDYFGWIGLEKKYFMTLLSYAKAGTYNLKQYYLEELKILQKESKELKNRVKSSAKLDQEDQAIFYSDWKYSAVRLSCDLENQNKSKIKEIFGLTDSETHKIVDFLLQNGLIKVENGEYKLGPASTHLSSDSPFIGQHHRNWRIKSLESAGSLDSEELLYSAPMVISQELFTDLRQRLVEFIEQFVQDATASEAENLYYLNIDLRKMLSQKKS